MALAIEHNRLLGSKSNYRSNTAGGSTPRQDERSEFFHYPAALPQGPILGELEIRQLEILQKASPVHRRKTVASERAIVRLRTITFMSIETVLGIFFG